MRSNKGFLDQYSDQLTARFTAMLGFIHKKRDDIHPLNHSKSNK
jgi:hypothetical protein